MKVKMIEEIKEYCKILKLKGILEHFEEVSDETKEPGEYLHKLLMHEIEEKDKKMIECRIRSAQFPYRKTIEEIEMDYLPEPMQEKLPQIISLDFIKKGKNIILTGNPGTGKTHIAIGLGLKACKIGYKVLYITIPLLVTELKECNNVKK
ncbi:MAG: ATP-binding protein, partial [Fusobacteriaceae bacterium]|nr:ATP-binding protein [Fusobacteriaceae bacterium]